jgi:hypothetical protein
MAAPYTALLSNPRTACAAVVYSLRDPPPLRPRGVYIGGPADIAALLHPTHCLNQGGDRSCPWAGGRHQLVPHACKCVLLLSRTPCASSDVYRHTRHTTRPLQACCVNCAQADTKSYGACQALPAQTPVTSAPGHPRVTPCNREEHCISVHVELHNNQVDLKLGPVALLKQPCHPALLALLISQLIRSWSATHGSTTSACSSLSYPHGHHMGANSSTAARRRMTVAAVARRC